MVAHHDRSPTSRSSAGWERAEQCLAEFATTRDPRLRNELLAEYDGFAISLVRELGTRRDTFEDLVQVARVGLLHAIDRFDPARQRPFMAFARATILGELKRHLRDHTWRIRPPRSLQERHLAVLRAADDLTQELGRSPFIVEIAHRTGLDEEQVLEAMDVSYTNALASLDQPSPEGTLPDPGEVPLSFAQVDNTLLVGRVLAELCERDRKLIQLRFEQGMSQAQIGEIFGVSQMCISRHLARALRRLRYKLDATDAMAI